MNLPDPVTRQIPAVIEEVNNLSQELSAWREGRKGLIRRILDWVRLRWLIRLW